jgi:predicted site-specific integrase-resolvase
MSVVIFPNRMNSKQAAEVLGVTEDTLAVWRCTKRYPLPYVKIGRKVFYRAEDLQNFIDARTVVVECV